MPETRFLSNFNHFLLAINKKLATLKVLFDFFANATKFTHGCANNNRDRISPKKA